MAAAHLRDNAETAGMIAALCDFQIGTVRRRQPEPRRVVVWNVSRPLGDKEWRKFGTCALIGSQDGILRHHSLDDGSQLCDLIQADKRIHFRQ